MDELITLNNTGNLHLQAFEYALECAYFNSHLYKSKRGKKTTCMGFNRIVASFSSPHTNYAVSP